MLIEEKCSCGAVFKLAPGAAAGRAATTEEIDTAWEEVDRWRGRHAGHVPDHLAPPQPKGPDATVIACVKRGGHYWPAGATKGQETVCVGCCFSPPGGFPGEPAERHLWQSQEAA